MFDLAIAVDTSCPMSVQEIVEQRVLIAQTFSALRSPRVTVIGSVQYFEQRVAYLELGSGADLDTLVGFFSNLHGSDELQNVDAVNTGENDDTFGDRKVLSNPSELNKQNTTTTGS